MDQGVNYSEFLKFILADPHKGSMSINDEALELVNKMLNHLNRLMINYYKCNSSMLGYTSSLDVDTMKAGVHHILSPTLVQHAVANIDAIFRMYESGVIQFNPEVDNKSVHSVENSQFEDSTNRTEVTDINTAEASGNGHSDEDPEMVSDSIRDYAQLIAAKLTKDKTRSRQKQEDITYAVHESLKPTLESYDRNSEEFQTISSFFRTVCEQDSVSETYLESTESQTRVSPKNVSRVVSRSRKPTRSKRSVSPKKRSGGRKSRTSTKSRSSRTKPKASSKSRTSTGPPSDWSEFFVQKVLDIVETNKCSAENEAVYRVAMVLKGCAQDMVHGIEAKRDHMTLLDVDTSVGKVLPETIIDSAKYDAFHRIIS